MNNLSRREFLQTSGAAGLLLASGASVSRIAPKEKTGFRIMQMTDTHFQLGERDAECLETNYIRCKFKNVGSFEQRNKRTVEDMKYIIEKYGPDVVVHTGDLWND